MAVSIGWLRPILIAFVFAQAGGARHAREPAGLPVPTRPLKWGDVNFLATSDTHGWLLGHQHSTWPEPNYSGDYGDFASFATHMRSMADNKGADLLLVDAGDHHDGSGLVSSSTESALRADEIFNQLDYDVMTIGNHELYDWTVARGVHEMAKSMNGRYLTSNVNITLLRDGQWVNTPIGERYRSFTTKAGRRVIAFGVIFDFRAHDYNLTIQSPRDMVRERWFKQAMADAPDYFVLVGHMPARGETSEWAVVFDAIRSVHAKVPIFVFGGHTHVRDCVQYDNRSIAIVPGRYMETVAFVSANLTTRHHSDALSFQRRYLDANRVGYQYHTNTNKHSFDTALGLNITLNLLNLATSLNISTLLGTAPRDLYLGRYAYGHTKSLLSAFANEVLPHAIMDEKRTGKRVIIGNAGTLRFDLFEGHFDRNDELTISPFSSAFLFVQLPAGLARLIEPEMNRAGASKLAPAGRALFEGPRSDIANQRMAERLKYADDIWVDQVYEGRLARQGVDASEVYPIYHEVDKQVVLGATERLTPGYITRDACPGEGDDIEHAPLPRGSKQPDFIASPFPATASDDEVIDVVVMDFSMDDFITAVHTLQPNSSLGPWDFAPYAEGISVNVVLGMYAQAKWQVGTLES